MQSDYIHRKRTKGESGSGKATIESAYKNKLQPSFAPVNVLKPQRQIPERANCRKCMLWVRSITTTKLDF